MVSPFPDMDPYLEGYLWSDVHHALASEIRKQIAPLIRPRYTARLAITTFHETLSDDAVSIFLLDVELLSHVDSPWNRQTRDEMAGEAVMAAPITEPITVPLAEIEMQKAIRLLG